jgi:2'-phosphotransferase
LLFLDFATGYPSSGEAISGMNNSCDTFIEINLEKALKESIQFYISKDGVILTPGVNGILSRVQEYRILIFT